MRTYASYASQPASASTFSETTFLTSLTKASSLRMWTATYLWMFDVESDAALAVAVVSYLSLAHVEHPRHGCPLPALSAEIARADDTVRKIFEQRLLQIQKVVRQGCTSEDEAWSLIAHAVGAVTLARAVHSSKIRKQLVGSAKRRIMQSLAAGTASKSKIKAAARTRR